MSNGASCRGQGFKSPQVHGYVILFAMPNFFTSSAELGLKFAIEAKQFASISGIFVCQKSGFLVN